MLWSRLQFGKLCRISGGKETSEGAFRVKVLWQQIIEYSSDQLEQKENLPKAMEVLTGLRGLENQTCNPQKWESSRECEDKTHSTLCPILDAAAGYTDSNCSSQSAHSVSGSGFGERKSNRLSLCHMLLSGCARAKRESSWTIQRGLWWAVQHLHLLPHKTEGNSPEGNQGAVRRRNGSQAAKT